MWLAVLLVGASGLVLLALLALHVGRRRMSERVEREVRSMIRTSASAGLSSEPVALDSFRQRLPDPVLRYLETAGVDRHPPVDFVRLRHGGTFSTDGGRSWKPVRGVEFFTADPPAFLWAGSIPVAPGVRVLARDRYQGGAGSMLISVGGLLTLDDLRGPEMDQASLLRYASELPLLPTALLPSERLSWEAVDETSARLRFRDAGHEVAGTYHFGADGLPEGFTARRYRTEGDEQVLRHWEGRYGEYRDVDGLAVPTSLAVEWVVESRREPYVRFELEAIEFDTREPW